MPLSHLLLAAEPPQLAPGIVHSNFSVQGDARHSFLSWQERMSPVYDIQPASKHADETFDAAMSRYSIDDLSFFHFRTGPNLAVRSLGRVSTENIRDVSFSVFLEGRPGEFVSGKQGRDASPIASVPTILALDMDQPCAVRSFHGRILLFFVPRALVEKAFPDAASLHGRRVEATTPLTRTLIAHLIALNRQIVGLSKDDARQSFLTAVELLAAAFSRQAGLSGNARAAVRAAVYGQVRRYVEAHLHDPDLSTERVLASLHMCGVPACTVCSSMKAVWRLISPVAGCEWPPMNWSAFRISKCGTSRRDSASTAHRVSTARFVARSISHRAICTGMRHYSGERGKGSRVIRTGRRRASRHRLHM
ncbi:hypothetical protein GGD41_002060 [Paraburkholderia bryophila]|uniref:AraC family transcriptional regulator n=1 Tax=Paraburkholderia bryophila TaxID=420952 RepID=A0A7Y9W5X5_9BURK|nr:hypothetical protein [Paraburkholderia bryophila]